VRCQPEGFELTCNDSASTVEFTLTLPEACEATAPAFLRMRFPVNGAACSPYATHPRLVLIQAENCTQCRSYNDVDQDELDPDPLEDMCTPDRIGNPV